MSLSPTSTALVMPTGARVSPEVLQTAIARAHRSHDRLHVVIPAVLPPTLPISAMPPHLAARLNALRDVALAALARLEARGRVEIVTGRDTAAVLRQASARPPQELFLAGTAGWSLRRAARAVAPFTVVSDRMPTPKLGREQSVYPRVAR